MLKKLVIAVALLGLLWGSVQAKTIISVGGDVPLFDTDKKETGTGGFLAIGQEIKKDEKVRAIGWLKISKLKSGGEGGADKVTDGYVGLTIFSDKFFHNKAGVYFTVGAGAGKIIEIDESQGVTSATAIGGGAFFSLSERTMLWLGLNQANTDGEGDTENKTIRSIQSGLSIAFDWK